MIVADVFDAIRPRHSFSELSELVSEILILEDRLSKQEDQTEYFRWGAQNHRNRLRELKRRYEKFRYRFNAYDTDDFLDEYNSRKSFLRDVVPAIDNPNIRYVARTDSVEIIAEVEDMLKLKGITSKLPEFDELKTQPEVILAILDN
jgi:hypothetical protein